MITGMYLSCMGAMAQQARHETIANNLANLDTTGFKPDFVNFMQIPAESVWKGMGRRESDRILEKTGGGVWLDSTTSDFAAKAPLKSTNDPLDVALLDSDGRVSFFKVRSGEGENAKIHYTRNGNFNLSPTGQLLTDTGMPVLNNADQPIILPPGQSVDIAKNGEIRVKGFDGQSALITQLGVASTTLYEAQKGLKKLGDSLFEAKEGTQMTDSQPQVASGQVEQSAVNQISEMVAMIEGQRTYNLNMKFLTMQDQALGSAIQKLTAQ